MKEKFSEILSFFIFVESLYGFYYFIIVRLLVIIFFCYIIVKIFERNGVNVDFLELWKNFFFSKVV